VESRSLGLYVTPRSSAGGTRFAITTGGAGAEQHIDTANPLPTRTLTHVAVTLSGQLGILYVGGVEVARNAAITVRPSALGGTTQNYLGRSQYAGDPFLDGVRLYSRALSASEIRTLAG
jgi:uncharacterized protein